MANPIIFGIITALHDIFTAIWIGGLFFMAIVLIPGIIKKRARNPESEQLINTIGKRLKYFVYVSIIGLIITGILLSRQAPLFTSPFSFANRYSIMVTIKHIIIIPMVVIALVKSIILDRLQEPSETIKKVRMALIFVNLLFGIAVLVLSGMSAAFANAPI